MDSEDLRLPVVIPETDPALEIARIAQTGRRGVVLRALVEV